jgi:hypothetical protein
MRNQVHHVVDLSVLPVQIRRRTMRTVRLRSSYFFGHQPVHWLRRPAELVTSLSQHRTS